MSRFNPRRLPPLVGVFVLSGLAMAGVASAQPAVPATFYGTVVVDGHLVPDGTEIRGWVGDRDCTQDGPAFRGSVTVDGSSQYSIEVMHESQEPGCAADGVEVRFTIGGQPAHQVALWRSGPQRVDLNAGVGDPADLPTPTATPTLVPADAGTTGTAEARFTPIIGETPPLDDVDRNDVVRGTGGSGAQGLEAESPANSREEDGEDGVVLWMVAGVIVLIIIGVVTGWILAGRRNLS
jgi:hypothetical protein